MSRKNKDAHPADLSQSCYPVSADYLRAHADALAAQDFADASVLNSSNVVRSAAAAAARLAIIHVGLIDESPGSGPMPGPTLLAATAEFHAMAAASHQAAAAAIEADAMATAARDRAIAIAASAAEVSAPRRSRSASTLFVATPSAPAVESLVSPEAAAASAALSATLKAY